MRKTLASLSLLCLLVLAACTHTNIDPIMPRPDPVYSAKLVGRDSIANGSYRGIAIGSSTTEAFSLLEQYRYQKLVSYLGAINTYFSNVMDLKDRLAQFDWLVLDESFDTESGIQIQLESGQVKAITLNNRRQLEQWPESVSSSQAIQVGDKLTLLYTKLESLSQRAAYTPKFERIVLLSRYSYALYDPTKSGAPWRFIYRSQAQSFDGVEIHLQNKKVQYIIVNRFEKL
ncbi:hypothetical protein [Spirosoma sp.]|uniref:hypothetical protein n=1 Tax=Spirosoma sp. TaxID=1899569 RepID=UPI0026377CE6|nr:hypothetical protein [Spirosoma sp.]MCX6216336.1 hypothetical protein [Spirosoma sp.]